MPQDLRKSGIEVVGDMPWGTHFCQFYQTKQDLIDTLVPYFKAGLENNEFCMWVTARPLSAAEARRAIAEAMPDFESYAAKGQIEIIPHTQWYLKGGSFDSDRVLNGWVGKLNAGLSRGFDGLRLTGNTFWLEKEGWKDFADYEAVVNSVIGQYRMVALCTYSLDKCSASEVLDVVRNHQFAMVKQEGKWQLIESELGKRNAEAVQHSQRALRDILESMDDGFVAIDRDWNFTYVNGRVADNLGVKPEDVVGKNVWTSFPNLTASFEAYWRKAMTERVPVHFEDRGAVTGLWYEVHVYPTPDGIAVYWNDITERRRIEQALQQSQQRMTDLLDSMDSPFVAHDREWRFTYVNEQAARNMGCDPRDLIGKNVWATLPQMVSPVAEAAYRKAMAERVPVRFEERGKVTDKWYECHVFPSQEGIAIFWTDLTERKKAEEEARSLARFPGENPNAVMRVDRDGAVLYANDNSSLLQSTWGAAVGQLVPGDWRQIIRDILEAGTKRVHEIHLGDRVFELVLVPISDMGYVNIYGKDVTESKMIEQALVESEQKYRGLFDSLTDAFFLAEIVFDDIGKPKDIRFVEVNEKWAENTGLSRDGLVGKTLLDLFPEADGYQIQVFGQVALTGNPVSYERYSPRIGRWNHIRAYSPRRGYCAAIYSDITERKKVEEALRETSDYLNNLFDYANAPIIVWDPRLLITRFNHAFERLTGLSADEVLGKEIGVLFPGSARKESLDYIRRAMAGERWETVEIPILRTDGTVRTVLWNSANLHTPDGKRVVATIAQGQDITERKLAEASLKLSAEQWSATFDSITDMISIHDRNFRVLRANKAFSDALAMKPEDVVGRLCYEMIHDKDGPIGGCPHSLTLKTESSVTVEVFEPKLNKYLEVTTSPLRDKGEIAGTVHIARDITARKKSELEINSLNESLRRRNAELEAANKELESFSYSVSHDLRAPLRNIAGFSQAVLEDYNEKLDDQGRFFLRRIDAGCQLMGKLIDDILRLSRVTRAEMRWEKVNLTELAETIASALRDSQPERRVEFVFAPGVVANGDRQLIPLVMENLLGNAWKFTQKCPEARIEFGVTEKDGRKAYFVRDNGAGFDMTYAGKLFMPFQRLHSNEEFPGTGIGLAIVQRVVHRHGGQVWADGDVGRGATFYFTLGG